MKSIDKFATEYAQDKYMPVQTSQAVKAGANYGLKQIEGHINRLEYGLNANCMVTAKNACECLRSIMEQLKK